MTELTHGTWVVIADGEKALFLENRTDQEDPFLQVMRIESQENPSDSDQGSEPPGRMAAPAGPVSAMQEADWHELAKDRFADEMAEVLYGLAHAGRFDRLVICAAPGTLGEMRSKLHKEVADRVVAEIPKVLTNHPLNEVERILRDTLA